MFRRYTAPNEVAVCNLASIALPRFVMSDVTNNEAFDFEALRAVTRLVTRSLDRVISATHYPLPEAESSNSRHRPCTSFARTWSNDLYDESIVHDWYWLVLFVTGWA